MNTTTTYPDTVAMLLAQVDAILAKYPDTVSAAEAMYFVSETYDSWQYSQITATSPVTPPVTPPASPPVTPPVSPPVPAPAVKSTRKP